MFDVLGAFNEILITGIFLNGRIKKDKKNHWSYLISYKDDSQKGFQSLDIDTNAIFAYLKVVLMGSF